MKVDLRSLSCAREQLLEEGFCLVNGHISDDKLEELQKWSDEWLRNTEHPPQWKYQGSDVKVNGIRNPANRFPDFPEDAMVDWLIEHPRAILDAMHLDDFRSGGTFQIISKPPRAPALYWHQDWARWDDPISMAPWPQQIFLNWYLTDTCVENGCLRVIPGSHRKRLDLHSHLIKPHEGGGYDVDQTNEWMFVDHPEALDVAVKTGELLIADARLLHGTHANLSQKRRTVLLGWFFRRGWQVPSHWEGDVPEEILQRDPELKVSFNREPGVYLR